MARSQSSGALKYVGAAAAAIVGGIAIGYLFGGARVPHPSVQTVQPPVSTTLTPAPSINPSGIHPRVTNGNYTAPGAPHIVIQEESQAVLRRVTPPVPPPDPEATQEAPPPAPAPSADTSALAASTSNPASSSTDSTVTPSGSFQTNSGVPSQSTPTPASPPPAPADPDFEHVNSGVKSAPPPSSTDPESGQQGGGQSQPDSSKVQFRVQTGAYTDESNARSVADTLRGQGYATSTRSERQGDHLVYKVQVGAFRSKTGASKAADDLSKKGYPAFISPISP